MKPYTPFDVEAWRKRGAATAKAAAKPCTNSGELQKSSDCSGCSGSTTAECAASPDDAVLAVTALNQTGRWSWSEAKALVDRGLPLGTELVRYCRRLDHWLASPDSATPPKWPHNRAAGARCYAAAWAEWWRHVERARDGPAPCPGTEALRQHLQQGANAHTN